MSEVTQTTPAEDNKARAKGTADARNCVPEAGSLGNEEIRAETTPGVPPPEPDPQLLDLSDDNPFLFMSQDELERLNDRLQLELTSRDEEGLDTQPEPLPPGEAEPLPYIVRVVQSGKVTSTLEFRTENEALRSAGATASATANDVWVVDRIRRRGFRVNILIDRGFQIPAVVQDVL